MLRDFLLLFLALRAADVVNLVGGLWLVPKYVAPEDLGAVLPLTAFATLVAIPIYTVAMTALRESSRLRAESAACRGRLRSFVRGVFAAVGVVTLAALAVTAALLPRYLGRLHVSDSLSGYLAVSAALCGCVAPVYLDQLQAAKRFTATGVVEIAAATLRLVTMAVTMPFRALAGYFAGGIAKTLVQILGPLLVLRRDAISARTGGRDPYWTHENVIRLAKTYLLLLPYLWLPMQVSLAENELVRTLLSAQDSAGYYMATRISDLFNYLTFPILFVMFPYVTDKASRGESYAETVRRACDVIMLVALAAIPVTACYGERLIALLPNGGDYLAYAANLPILILFMAAGAVQSVITNALVAAGRFGFLCWFIPLNVAYLGLLSRCEWSIRELAVLITVFTVFAVVRDVFALVQLRIASGSRTTSRQDSRRISGAPDRNGSVRS